MTRSFYLHPGDLLVAPTPVKFHTILGSCVSLCLLDEKIGLAGMNHFLLPSHPEAETKEPNRFGDLANANLLEELIARGAKKNDLRAKMFGGANVLQNVNIGRDIGLQNAEITKNFLLENKIPLVCADIGGESGRKIIFCSDGFQVSCEPIKRNDSLSNKSSTS